MAQSNTAELFREMIRVLGYKQAMGQRSVFVSEHSRQILDQLKQQPGPATASLPVSPANTVQSTTADPGGTQQSAAAPKGGGEQNQGEEAELDWEPLREAVLGCRKCRLCQSRTNAVFGAGCSQADLMFVGEGPGEQEDLQGEPFVGRAGQLLTRMIEAMQFTREQVFITNVVKCRPPSNRVPYTDEAETCLPYLRRQIRLIQPKVVVLLGSTALHRMLGKSSITAEHGVWQQYHRAWVMPTFHPSYLLRSPSKKADAWEDLKKVMVYLGKNPEQTVDRNQ